MGEKSDVLGSTSSSYLSNTFEACVSLGCPLRDLLKTIPGGQTALDNPSKRFNGHVLLKMLHTAEHLTGTVGIGALTGRFLRPSAMSHLGHAMVASSTLYDMIKMYRIYQPIMVQIGQADVEIKGNQAFVGLDSVHSDVNYLRPYLEKFFGGVASFGRWVTWDQDMAIQEMHFRHSKPADLTAYEDVFQCPVYFGAGRDVMIVPRDLVEHPMPQPNPELVESLKPLMKRDLVAIGQPITTRMEVLRLIRSTLMTGAPSIENIADRLGTTERTLRRRLKAEGTNYRALLEDVRRQACELELSRGVTKLTDLADALGYSEQSALTRAFKDWYGVPPSKYMREPTSDESE